MKLPCLPSPLRRRLRRKLERDAERLEKSGLPVFERALVDYLVTDRSHDFLDRDLRSHRVASCISRCARSTGARSPSRRDSCAASTVRSDPRVTSTGRGQRNAAQQHGNRDGP